MRIWISDGGRHTHDESGYGQLSAGLISGLERLGHEVRLGPFEEMETCLFICPPSSIRQLPAVPTAAFTMHELDHLPENKQDWPNILNRLNMLITPTSWNREIWERLGVKIPIEVVPLGVNEQAFSPVTGTTCKFLSVHENLGSDSSRENWRDTMRAYLMAFTAEDAVELLIKTWKWKPDAWEQARIGMLSELGIPGESAAAIRVLEDRLSSEAMNRLYQDSWLFVKNANREGWSLPCTEAVASGINVAATSIQPLLSHLPEDTIWFQAGDSKELSGVLSREYARFQAFVRRCHGYTIATTAVLTERALAKMLSGPPVVGLERHA